MSSPKSEAQDEVLLRPTRTRLQVRFSDTDQLGHINNQSYAGYAEIGRSDFFDRIAGDEKPWFVLSRLEMVFHREGHFGDELSVITRVSHFGRSTLTASQDVVRGADDELVCSMTAVMVCIDTASRKPRRIPRNWVLAPQDGALWRREIVDLSHEE